MAIRNLVKCKCRHPQAAHYGGSVECWATNCTCIEYRPNALNVVRWKVVRKTCGICRHGFPDNTGSSICTSCFSDALTCRLINARENR